MAAGPRSVEVSCRQIALRLCGYGVTPSGWDVGWDLNREYELVNHLAAERSIRSRIGVSIDVTHPADILQFTVDAERLGVEQLWLTQVSESVDALSIIAAAFTLTERIRIGTSIVPIYPLHPLAMAQQANTVGALGAGRFRLGVGPSTKSRVKRVYGLEMTSPLAYLGEYVSILRDVLWTGTVDHEGPSFTAKMTLDNDAMQVPVLTSALGKSAFRQAGAIADGAISWNCPPSYLQSVALPAITEGATSVGRSVPPLVAHICVALTADRDLAMEAGRTHLSFYVRHPFYSSMFAVAGYPISDDGSVPEGLIESLVIMGDENQVADGLRSLLDSGIDDVLISNFPVEGRHESDRRLMKLIGSL